jgi:hypothetical protein
VKLALTLGIDFDDNLRGDASAQIEEARHVAA